MQNTKKSCLFFWDGDPGAVKFTVPDQEETKLGGKGRLNSLKTRKLRCLLNTPFSGRWGFPWECSWSARYCSSGHSREWRNFGFADNGLWSSYFTPASNVLVRDAQLFVSVTCSYCALWRAAHIRWREQYFSHGIALPNDSTEVRRSYSDHWLEGRSCKVTTSLFKSNTAPSESTTHRPHWLTHTTYSYVMYSYVMRTRQNLSPHAVPHHMQAVQRGVVAAPWIYLLSLSRCFHFRIQKLFKSNLSLI